MSSFFSQDLILSPARNSISSPITAANSDAARRYLTELLAEREKLAPFIQILPICKRLLDQEIRKASERINNPNQLGLRDESNINYMVQTERINNPNQSWYINEVSSLLNTMRLSDDAGATTSGGGTNSHNSHGGCCSICNMQKHESLAASQDMVADSTNSSVPPPTSSSSTVIKHLRLDIPANKYPNFNFLGRLLGPRGNSLKRIEESTNCRVFIRGKGSIRDPRKEDRVKFRKGYEHLSEPLHILITANLPATIVDAKLAHAKEIIERLLKPVAPSQDLYKKEQLRELEMLKHGSSSTASTSAPKSRFC